MLLRQPSLVKANSSSTRSLVESPQRPEYGDSCNAPEPSGVPMPFAPRHDTSSVAGGLTSASEAEDEASGLYESARFGPQRLAAWKSSAASWSSRATTVS